MGSAAAIASEVDGPASKMESAVKSLASGRGVGGRLGSLDLRADPDAQATVTDFLDFAEYLPSDMMRSLTLIGKLDQTYNDASEKVHSLTTKWGQLPSLPQDERPSPAQLRAEISENLSQTVSSRIYSHAEAVRMAENVNRHYKRAKVILTKLQVMMDNWRPPEEQKSPVAGAKSPQMLRGSRVTLRMDGQKVRRPHVPRITVPGEVLAPYELNYESYSSDSESSSDEDDEDDMDTRQSATQPRIRLIKNAKPPKIIKVTRPLPSRLMGAEFSARTTLTLPRPNPNGAPIGSAEAPWLQLTTSELATLRKRMKKNSAWAPSDTMIARELKNLGRGVEAFKEASLRAEEEGRLFDGTIPVPFLDADTGTEHLPAGALGLDMLNALEKSTKPKALKPEQLAKLAAEEAEASTRRMQDLARAMLGGSQTSLQSQSRSTSQSKAKKRKRDSIPDGEKDKPGSLEVPDQHVQFKRTKTETPVPHPQPTQSSSSQSTQEKQAPLAIQQSTTPIPLPMLGHDPSKLATSPTPSTVGASGTAIVTTTVPLKPAADGPARSPRVTPIPPPVRETRNTQALRAQNHTPAPITTRSSSRPQTPAPKTPVLELDEQGTRRPMSRGNAASQEPQATLATERQRRASTARNTPAPEPPSRPVSRRAKRPAPGVVSRTSSGGNSAVTKRKAAPKKRARKKDKEVGGGVGEVEVEVDEDGNAIDPDEPRYCICNGVSFGTMIQCENMENCKQEWFHLECVGLEDVPARTTKWYCPDCRVKLNIGEKGEVNARGVRA